MGFYTHFQAIYIFFFLSSKSGSNSQRRGSGDGTSPSQQTQLWPEATWLPGKQRREEPKALSPHPSFLCSG